MLALNKDTDRKDRIIVGQEATSLRSGGCQHTRSRPGEVEEEIRLLDSGSASGGTRDCEGSVGCAGCRPSSRFVGEVTMVDGDNNAGEEIMLSSRRHCIPSSSTTYHDDPSCATHSWFECLSPTDSFAISLYDALGGVPLGVQEDVLPDESQSHQRACFNCGSFQHIVTACPKPLNKELISLARQLYHFSNDHSASPHERIHEVEAQRRQRLEWLETFEPGQVRGDLLREALDLRSGDSGEYVEWLRNMTFWGYPRGWSGHTDPREAVRKIIAGEVEEGPELSDEGSMTIFGDDGDREKILISHPTLSSSSVDPFPSTAHPSNPTDEPSFDKAARRWATYPDTYFLSSALPIYNGLSLPPLFESAGVVEPPPPCNTPPPLPPDFPLADVSTYAELGDGSEADMDLSD